MAYHESAEDIYNAMFLGYTATSTGKGSLLFNSNFPIAMKISDVLLDLDEATNKVFAKRALQSGYSPFLDLRVEEMGITRKEATYALIEITVKGSPKVILKKDSIVGTSDNRLYIVQSDLVLDETGIGKVTIKAEKPGSQYNVNIGEINYLPIKYSGIISITNEKAYLDAYDQESDQDVYDRYQLKVQTPATSGNKYHYQNWALEVDGVGSAKVYPLWDKNNGMNGNGTVKVVIASSNKRAASQELIQKVYNHIEEERPIGVTLTVASVIEKPISVTANIQISSTTNLNIVQGSFTSALENYLKDTFNSTKVSIMKIGSLLLDIDGVLDLDYSSLKINGMASNITLKDDEIAVLATNTPVVLGVM